MNYRYRAWFSMVVAAICMCACILLTSFFYDKWLLLILVLIIFYIASIRASNINYSKVKKQYAVPDYVAYTFAEMRAFVPDLSTITLVNGRIGNSRDAKDVFILVTRWANKQDLDLFQVVPGSQDYFIFIKRSE